MTSMWNSLLASGIDFLDRDHEALCRFLDKLSPGQLETDPAVFADLRNRIETHFRDEEEEMLRVHYPGLREHQEEHRHFIDQMDYFADAILSGRFRRHGEVLQFVSLWIISHLLGADRNMARHIRSLMPVAA